MGYYENAADNKCTDCTSPCADCITTGDTCIACSDPLYLESNNCVTGCSDGLYAEDAGRMCIACHEYCLTCSGASNYC